MGIFDFILGAGDKVAAESDQERSAKLENHVRKMGLEVERLKVDVSDDKATVSGKVDSQQVREKVILAVGNTAGIANVDDKLEVVKKEPEAKFYTVKSGDSLSKIAKEYYGDAMKYPTIFEANKPMLSDPDKIYPGQVLRIPPSA
jgi:nucleoid-associated protein YgaU